MSEAAEASTEPQGGLCEAALASGMRCTLRAGHGGSHSFAFPVDAPGTDDETEADERAPGVPDGWKECPCCAGAGQVPTELQPSPQRRTCADCLGMGKVLTGSLVGDHAVEDCPTCMGRGYTDKPIEPPQPGQEPQYRY